MGRTWLEDDLAGLQELCEQEGLGRIAKPKAVVQILVLCVRPDSSSMTVAAVSADCGMGA